MVASLSARVLDVTVLARPRDLTRFDSGRRIHRDLDIGFADVCGFGLEFENFL